MRQNKFKSKHKSCPILDEAELIGNIGLEILVSSFLLHGHRERGYYLSLTTQE